MFSHPLRVCFVLLLTGCITACKLAVLVTDGGDVSSLSTTRDCAGGTICEFEITDSTFSEIFTAVPKPGYQFVRWRNGGADFFCADSVSPSCTLTNVGTAGNVAVEAIIASFQLFHIMPVFEFIGIDSDLDGMQDHVDDDDDNDGILDVDDACPLDPDPTCGGTVMVEQLIADTCWTVSADVGNAAAQSFVAPANGTITEIGFAIEGDGAANNLIILEGDVDGVALYFQAIATPDIAAGTAAIVPYTLEVPLAVTSGQQYTIAIDDTGGFGLRFCGSSANPYASGHAYEIEFFSSTPFVSRDAAFSVSIE
ncbi:MAG: hypothetical protein ACI9JM_001305 [Halioglobus sp.]|jgi:hypothetical protein